MTLGPDDDASGATAAEEDIAVVGRDEVPETLGLRLMPMLFRKDSGNSKMLRRRIKRALGCNVLRNFARGRNGHALLVGEWYTFRAG